MGLLINGAVFSSNGIIRAENEDNYYIFGNYIEEDAKEKQYSTEGRIDKRAFFAVFDGMGGTGHGKVASYQAALQWEENLSDLYLLEEEKEIEAFLKKQVLLLNNSIWEKSKIVGNMGTTIALLYVTEKNSYILNVGDSRVYGARSGEICQFSKDHNMAQFLLDMKMISPKEYRAHRGKHQLTQFLGVNQEEMIIEPYFCTQKHCSEQEKYMICTDGLTEVLDNEEIKSILASETSPKNQAEQLIHLAMEKRSSDNLTAMVLHVTRKNM